MTRRLTRILFCFLLVAPAALRAEDRYFDSKGVKIRYRVEGQGEPVLLIHGYAGDLDFGKQTLIPALAKDHQVIAYDSRGHGKSDKPHDSKQYGLEMVEDAVRLLDHLKIKKAHVIGYSMGALITHKLLTLHPNRVLTATLGGQVGLRDTDDFSFLETMAQEMEQGKGMTSLLVLLTPAGQPQPTDDQQKATTAWLNATQDLKALAGVARRRPGLPRFTNS